MGNCFSGCTESDDSASSSGREKNAKGKRRFKLTTRNNAKASRKNPPSSTPRDKLSITSVKSSNEAGTVGTKSECLSDGRQSIEDLTVIGRALPIVEKPERPGIEPGASNARIIVVQPSATSENSSKETFPGEGIKRPITGSKSNASLSSLSSLEELECDDDLEELSLDEESSSALEPPRVSEEPERSSYLQLLEFLKIRLDMAVNNMEIDKLIANVDCALDRAARTRELGFRRMRAAEEARLASRHIHEETGTASSDEDETEDENDEESEEGGGTPPPPIPRVCWQ
ncbi:hypothetical protein ACROYT_G016559 [Oculina patagonica]